MIARHLFRSIWGVVWSFVRRPFPPNRGGSAQRSRFLNTVSKEVFNLTNEPPQRAKRMSALLQVVQYLGSKLITTFWKCRIPEVLVTFRRNQLVIQGATP
jgi:hypothetical protein